ncbi:hypothetical protein [Nocardia cyriacigeorgica]|uniref:hypothetical protein n=1 Tax=Nocardia cyriacigeorgica TaxID=135487 RepID=UPI00189518A4|nr:hypothetical protein [Nocardia cyriacigeorgica]
MCSSPTGSARTREPLLHQWCRTFSTWPSTGGNSFYVRESARLLNGAGVIALSEVGAMA